MQYMLHILAVNDFPHVLLEQLLCCLWLLLCS